MQILFFLLMAATTVGQTVDDPGKPEFSSCDPLLQLQSDAALIGQIPDIPFEALQASFETFNPRNASQDEALDLVDRLLEIRTNDSVGLLLSAKPGLGKTHLAIAAARRANELSMRVLYLNPDSLLTYRRTKLEQIPVKGIKDADKTAEVIILNRNRLWSPPRPHPTVLKNFDLIIVDGVDQNSSLTELGGLITWLHQAGERRVLITTTQKPRQLLKRIYADNPMAKHRFTDRFRAMFHAHRMKGKSHRPSVAWVHD